MPVRAPTVFGATMMNQEMVIKINSDYLKTKNNMEMIEVKMNQKELSQEEYWKEEENKMNEIHLMIIKGGDGVLEKDGCQLIEEGLEGYVLFNKEAECCADVSGDAFTDIIEDVGNIMFCDDYRLTNGQCYQLQF
ncbi:MAG: hypothetical protein EZS28_023663 [Streblomastix strix]|uniref:Uncharacterized protein n=1 Tax=Streblomastix strix TaxID=222440 RepID=A0A5J4VE04_9EUKA|nr:MAG: hypothetical protein EZS28_023663 [Streblomastix strix]